MTVPFIMALGLGVSSVREDNDNSFGLTGVCSIGPVIAVLIYSLVLKNTILTEVAVPELVEGVEAATESV